MVSEAMIRIAWVSKRPAVMRGRFRSRIGLPADCSAIATRDSSLVCDQGVHADHPSGIVEKGDVAVNNRFSLLLARGAAIPVATVVISTVAENHLPQQFPSGPFS